MCGARRPFVSISQTGLCPDHSRMRMTENLRGMATKSGPAYVHYLRQSALKLRAHFLDAVSDEG